MEINSAGFNLSAQLDAFLSNAAPSAALVSTGEAERALSRGL